ncbi:hypothetical protein HMPREF1979_01804, partial [Actinomyces johnsonii F0542]
PPTTDPTNTTAGSTRPPDSTTTSDLIPQHRELIDLWYRDFM